MKAFILGINGFVGGYLAEHLIEQGIEVYGSVEVGSPVLSIENCTKLFTIDILNKEQILAGLNEVKPDYIFHLAAQSSAALSWKLPQLTMEVNIIGTINLLEAIKDLKLCARTLLVGSSEEYGIVNEADLPVSEEQQVKPENPYAISKASQTMIGKLYSKVFGLDIIMVRAFNHIGPRQTPQFAVPSFAKQIAEMEQGLLPPTLKVGNLDAVRDFTDVRDIVRAYGLIMRMGKNGEVYNVGTGQSIALREILNTLLSFACIEIAVETDPLKLRPSDMPIILADVAKLVNDTGWHPIYSIENTLLSVLDYWRTETRKVNK